MRPSQLILEVLLEISFFPVKHQIVLVTNTAAVISHHLSIFIIILMASLVPDYI